MLNLIEPILYTINLKINPLFCILIDCDEICL